jgi:hypothetical protein
LNSRLGIALQAIAVAALVAVVYVAFLKPGDSGPLTVIDVRDGTDEPSRSRAAASGELAGPPRAGADGESGDEGAAPSALGPPAEDPEVDVVEVDTPAASQYVSAAARITARVAGAPR